ncbi:MAG TPA: methylmalonyl-CoA mutase family protein, partial [Limnochordales bacterium]
MSRTQDRLVQLPAGGMQERKPRFLTTSGVAVKGLYGPSDVAGLDYERDLGDPGQYPFTRGIHATMYRGRLWT